MKRDPRRNGAALAAGAVAMAVDVTAVAADGAVAGAAGTAVTGVIAAIVGRSSHVGLDGPRYVLRNVVRQVEAVVPPSSLKPKLSARLKRLIGLAENSFGFSLAGFSLAGFSPGRFSPGRIFLHVACFLCNDWN